MPPSDAPRTGHTDESAHAGRYVNDTPLDENCCPFIDTSTRRRPDDDDDDAAHSATPQPTTRAAAVATLDSKRQRIVADSRKLLGEPKTETRVPPESGECPSEPKWAPCLLPGFSTRHAGPVGRGVWAGSQG